MLRSLFFGSLLASLLLCAGCGNDPAATAQAEKSPELAQPKAALEIASQLGDAAVVYRRAYGTWPLQPEQLMAKLERQPDLRPLENLQFLTMDEGETFVLTFTLASGDYTVVKFLDVDPVSPSEARTYASSDFRIPLK